MDRKRNVVEIDIDHPVHKGRKKGGARDDSSSDEEWPQMRGGKIRPEQKIRRCQILATYIRERSEDLADAIRSLCLEQILYPSKFDEGLTFLYPSSEMINQIVKETFEGDSALAVTLIRRLVLGRAFKTPEDFETFKDDIICKKGYKFRYVSRSKDKVTLDDGFVLKKAPFSHKGNVDLVVWDIDAGQPPETGEMAERKRKPMKNEGGDKNGRERMSIVREYVEAYRNQLGGDIDRVHPLMVGSVSLCNFLKAFASDVYETVLPLLDADPRTSFFLLMAEPAIPDHLMTGSGNPKDPDHLRYGWGGVPLYGDAQENWKAHIKRASVLAKPKFKGREISLEEAHAKIRDEIKHLGDAAAMKKAATMYREFTETGKIGLEAGSLQPMGEEEWRKLYRDRESKKAVQDQARYIIPMILDDRKGGDDHAQALLEEAAKLFEKDPKSEDLMHDMSRDGIGRSSSNTVHAWLRSPNFMHMNASPFPDFNREKMKRVDALMAANHQPPLVYRYMSAILSGSSHPSHKTDAKHKHEHEEPEENVEAIDFDDDSLPVFDKDTARSTRRR